MSFGWDSLESVSAIHGWLQVASFALLGILLISAVLSFVYGNRKDVLSRQATKSQIEHAERSERPRRLSDDEKQRLVAALLPYAGQKVLVSRIKGDTEAEPLANGFVDVFVAAKWVFDGKPDVLQSVYAKEPIGIEVAVNRADAWAHQPPRATYSLVFTLFKLGLISREISHMDPKTPSGMIEVRVGKRPSDK